MNRLSLTALALGVAAALARGGQAPEAGDPAARIAQLCKQMGEGEYGNEGACKQLVEIGAPAMPQLLATLKDRRPPARFWAVVAIARIGTDEGYNAVLDVLHNDPHPYVRGTAVYYLRFFKNKDVWPIIEDAVADKEVYVARYALVAMVEENRPKVDEVLRKTLSAGSPELRSYALEHVRRMAEKDPARAKGFLPLVGQLLSNPDPRVRYDAIHTTVVLMEGGQLDFLRETFQRDKDPIVKEGALRCVTVIRNPSVEALDLFLQGMESDDGKVREAASKLLLKGVKHYIGFDPKGPLPRREAAIAEWRTWLRDQRAKLQWHSDVRKFLLPGDRPKAEESPAKSEKQGTTK